MGFRKLFSLNIFIGGMIATLSTPAFAVECTRYHLDHSGFTNVSAAASWYPEKVTIHKLLFTEIEGQKSLLYIDIVRMKEGNDYHELWMRYQLLPSGKMFVSLKQAGGFKKPGGARYNCNKNAVEIWEYLKKFKR